MKTILVFLVWLNKNDADYLVKKLISNRKPNYEGDMVMKKANILIVDDNKSILSALELLLKGCCRKVKCLSTPNNLMSDLLMGDYDILLLDMNFNAGINSGNEGIYWLQRVLEASPGISVVMITAYGDVELAVKAIRLGATDFVLKPWQNEKLMATLESAFKLSRSKKEVKQLKQNKQHLIAELNAPKTDIIGNSSAWQYVLKLVQKVAATSANVLITGENGTGKEIIAREIHRLSPRANNVMVTVDMGSIAETLFESELFGHKKGAFTDANTDRTGKIETAKGGTLFLDEIGNLPMAMQAKLLTTLQRKTITKVGENLPVDVDIRLICATNANITQLIENNLFREDLLYRINTIQIELPPLRSRLDDIPDLANFFLKKYAKKYHKTGVTLSDTAIERLKKYSWPGNVRELQHAIEKAVILGDSPTLSHNDFIFRTEEIGKNSGFQGTLEEMEMQLIEVAIKKQNVNMTAVAAQLGITRQTLYNKIKRYGL